MNEEIEEMIKAAYQDGYNDGYHAGREDGYYDREDEINCFRDRYGYAPPITWGMMK